MAHPQQCLSELDVWTMLILIYLDQYRAITHDILYLFYTYQHMKSEKVQPQLFKSVDDFVRLTQQISNQDRTLRTCLGAMIFRDPQDYNFLTGTFFLISQDLALTCAHNFQYSKFGKQKRYVNFRLYLAIYGSTSQFQEHRIAMKNPLAKYEHADIEELCAFIPQKNYKGQRAAGHEYAFFKLDKPVEGLQNYLTLGVNLDKAEYSPLGVFGYPSEQLGNYKKHSNQHFYVYPYCQKQQEQKGNGRNIQQIKEYSTVEYKVPTAQGQSGSPVVLNHHRHVVTGIHIGGKKEDKTNKEFINCARVFDKSFIKSLEDWRYEYKAHKFKVCDLSTGKQLKEFNQINQYQVLIEEEEGHAFPPESSRLISDYQKKDIIREKSELGFTFSRIIFGQEWNLLKHLILENSSKDARKLGWFGCKKISQCHFPVLETLDLSQCDIRYKGCRYLQSTQLPKLISLYLNDNDIKNHGCRELSQSSWPRLSHLQLRGNSIDQRGCEWLKEGKWPLLELDLTQNKITNQGCKQLSTADWHNIRKIIVRSNLISATRHETIQQYFKPRKVTVDFTEPLLSRIFNWVKNGSKSIF